ncbi:hypothetical protein YC2023_082075 [Brassica napus]
MKLDSLMTDLTDNEILGKTVACKFIFLLIKMLRKKEGALLEIEKILKSNETSLSNWEKMPKPFCDVADNQNVLILDELSYNHEELSEEHDRDIVNMTDEQRNICEEIMDAVIEKKGGLFFVYGFGGTGKTFLWRLLSAPIRSRGKIVLNVASSGIASLLLQGGRTAHSRFGIPIDPDEYSLCNLPPRTDSANLVKEASLIIWDEAPMMSKHCEERIYLSSDSIDPSDTRSVNDQALTPDFLNSIKASGLPNHKLRLKIGCPVMLMRNIDHVGGLMNGTRLQIIDMSDLCVKARIITGKKVGEVFLIPRLFITPSDKKLSFKMRRRHLPICGLCYHD